MHVPVHEVAEGQRARSRLLTVASASDGSTKIPKRLSWLAICGWPAHFQFGPQQRQLLLIPAACPKPRHESLVCEMGIDVE
jgi:hypothetical protein